MRFGRSIIVGLLACTLNRAFAGDIQLVDPGTISPRPGEIVTVQILVPGLAKGARVKVKGLQGQAKARTVTQPGLLVVDYQAPRTATEPTDQLTIASRSLGIEETIELQFSPRVASIQELRLEPGWVETRPGGAAYAEVRAVRTSGDAPWLRASQGELSKPKLDGDDWVWTWSSGQTPEASAVVGFLLMDPRQPRDPTG